jgi:hypothetical protein
MHLTWLRLVLAIPAVLTLACSPPANTAGGYSNSNDVTGSKQGGSKLPDPDTETKPGKDTPAPPPPSKGDGSSAKPGQLVASAVNPMGATTTSGDTPIVVTGSGFVSGSKITFAGADLDTRFVSASKLSATVAASRLSTPGTIAIAVVNPPPAGGTSPPVYFTVSDGRITLSSISPTSAPAGSSGLTLTATGQGFGSGATVNFNGTTLTPRAGASSTQLTVQIPATLLVDAGDYSVAVGGSAGVSAPLSFHVTSSKPVFSTFSPGALSTSTTSQTVTLSGRGFDGTSRATVALCDTCQAYIAPTTQFGSTELDAEIDSYFLATPGTLVLRVYNESGGQVQYADASGSLDVVGSGVGGSATPTLSYISPSSATAGSSGMYVNVHGSGFDTTTTVVVGSSDVTTYHDSSTSVSFYFSSSDLAYDSKYPNGYSYTIRVYNTSGGSTYYATGSDTFDVN